jgi:hypothetical protein
VRQVVTPDLPATHAIARVSFALCAEAAYAAANAWSHPERGAHGSAATGAGATGAGAPATPGAAGAVGVAGSAGAGTAAASTVHPSAGTAPSAIGGTVAGCASTAASFACVGNSTIGFDGVGRADETLHPSDAAAITPSPNAFIMATRMPRNARAPPQVLAASSGSRICRHRPA